MIRCARLREGERESFTCPQDTISPKPSSSFFPPAYQNGHEAINNKKKKEKIYQISPKGNTGLCRQHLISRFDSETGKKKRERNKSDPY